MTNLFRLFFVFLLVTYVMVGTPSVSWGQSDNNSSIPVQDPRTRNIFLVDPSIFEALQIDPSTDPTTLDDPTREILIDNQKQLLEDSGIAAASSTSAASTNTTAAPSGNNSSSTSNGGTSAVIGCDPEYMKEAQKVQEALQQADAAAIQSMIAPPSPILATSCTDKHAKKMSSEIGCIFTDPENCLDDTLPPIVEASIAETITAVFSGDIFNVASTVFESMFAESVSGLLDGGTTAKKGISSDPDVCDAAQHFYEIQKCASLPNIPSPVEIMNGAAEAAIEQANAAIDELTSGVLGDITNVVNMIDNPIGALSQACEGISADFDSYMGDITSNIGL